MHIQQLLGHKSYETTLIYAHVSTESHRGQVIRLPYAKLPSEQADERDSLAQNSNLDQVGHTKRRGTVTTR